MARIVRGVKTVVVALRLHHHGSCSKQDFRLHDAGNSPLPAAVGSQRQPSSRPLQAPKASTAGSATSVSPAGWSNDPHSTGGSGALSESLRTANGGV